MGIFGSEIAALSSLNAVYADDVGFQKGEVGHDRPPSPTSARLSGFFAAFVTVPILFGFALASPIQGIEEVHEALRILKR